MDTAVSQLDIDYATPEGRCQCFHLGLHWQQDVCVDAWVHFTYGHVPEPDWKPCTK